MADLQKIYEQPILPTHRTNKFQRKENGSENVEKIPDEEKDDSTSPTEKKIIKVVKKPKKSQKYVLFLLIGTISLFFLFSYILFFRKPLPPSVIDKNLNKRSFSDHEKLLMQSNSEFDWITMFWRTPVIKWGSVTVLIEYEPEQLLANPSNNLVISNLKFVKNFMERQIINYRGVLNTKNREVLLKSFFNKNFGIDFIEILLFRTKTGEERMKIQDNEKLKEIELELEKQFSLSFAEHKINFKISTIFVAQKNTYPGTVFSVSNGERFTHLSKFAQGDFLFFVEKNTILNKEEKEDDNYYYNYNNNWLIGMYATMQASKNYQIMGSKVSFVNGTIFHAGMGVSKDYYVSKRRIESYFSIYHDKSSTSEGDGLSTQGFYRFHEAYNGISEKDKRVSKPRNVHCVSKNGLFVKKKLFLTLKGFRTSSFGPKLDEQNFCLITQETYRKKRNIILSDFKISKHSCILYYPNVQLFKATKDSENKPKSADSSTTVNSEQTSNAEKVEKSEIVFFQSLWKDVLRAYRKTKHTFDDVKVLYDFGAGECSGWFLEAANFVTNLEKKCSIRVVTGRHDMCEGLPSYMTQSMNRMLVDKQNAYKLKNQSWKLFTQHNSVNALQQHVPKKTIWISHKAPDRLPTFPYISSISTVMTQEDLIRMKNGSSSTPKAHQVISDFPSYIISRAMHESYTLPIWWKDAIENFVDEIWVPSLFMRDAFMRIGVPKDKIFHVQEAVDVYAFDPKIHDPLFINSLNGANNNDDGLFVPIDSSSPEKFDISRFKNLRHVVAAAQASSSSTTNNHENNEKPNHKTQKPDEEKKKYFNFLSVFKWEERKGPDLLFEAYFKEFSREDPVKLFALTYVYLDSYGRSAQRVNEKIMEVADAIFDKKNPEIVEKKKNIEEELTKIRISSWNTNSYGSDSTNSKDSLSTTASQARQIELEKELEALEQKYNELRKTFLKSLPRYEIISDILPENIKPRLYKSADAYVLPSRGEGWGLPYMEAMAMGLPTIGTRGTGQLDFMNEENSFLIDNGLTEAEIVENHNKNMGKYKETVSKVAKTGDFVEFVENLSRAGSGDTIFTYAIPSVEDLMKKMRFVFANKKIAAERGQTARKYIKKFFSSKKIRNDILNRVNYLRNKIKENVFFQNYNENKWEKIYKERESILAEKKIKEDAERKLYLDKMNEEYKNFELERKKKEMRERELEMEEKQQQKKLKEMEKKEKEEKEMREKEKMKENDEKLSQEMKEMEQRIEKEKEIIGKLKNIEKLNEEMKEIETEKKEIEKDTKKEPEIQKDTKKEPEIEIEEEKPKKAEENPQKEPKKAEENPQKELKKEETSQNNEISQKDEKKDEILQKDEKKEENDEKRSELQQKLGKMEKEIEEAKARRRKRRLEREKQQESLKSEIVNQPKPENLLPKKDEEETPNLNKKKKKERKKMKLMS